jgi:hypothetical protein
MIVASPTRGLTAFSPWTGGAASVDYWLPMRKHADLQRGLIFAYAPGIANPFDRVGGNLGVITNVAKVNIRRTLGMRFAGGADLNSVVNFGTQASTANLANGPATWAFYCATTDLTRLCLACHEDNNVAGGWQVGTNQNGHIGLNVIRATTNLRFGATLTGFDTGFPISIVVTHSGSLTEAGCHVYANGVLQTPAAGQDGSGASAAVPAESFFLGRGRISTNKNMSGDIYACAIANRAWSAAEAAAFNADPYALFGRSRWAATSGPPIVGNTLFFGAGSTQ